MTDTILQECSDVLCSGKTFTVWKTSTTLEECRSMQTTICRSRRGLTGWELSMVGGIDSPSSCLQPP